MSLFDGGEHEFHEPNNPASFSFQPRTSFDAVVTVIPALGMKLRSQDRLIGRVTATTGMSLFSYGENITVAVQALDPASSSVTVASDLKVGLNIGGTQRHSRNFNNVIDAVSGRLQGRALPEVRWYNRLSAVLLIPVVVLAMFIFMWLLGAL